MADGIEADTPTECAVVDPRDGTREQHLAQRVRELERELTESRSASVFLQSVLQAVPAFITNLDPDLNIRFLNRYQPGHSAESVIGKSVFDYMAPEDHAIVREAIDRARTTGQVTSYALHHAAGPGGAPASYLTRVAPVHEPDGRIGACLAFVDITEEMRREQMLRETQDNLQLALDATGLGLWSWDAQTGAVVWDERMRALHGHHEPLLHTAYAEKIVHPEDRELLRGAFSRPHPAGAFQLPPYRIVRPDGETRWVLTVGREVFGEDGTMLKVVGGSLDATHQQELEGQFRKSQRMAAVANLTAGVAHNFNNMLAVIVPILEFATPLVPAEHRAMLRDASHAAGRATELVRQLMTYAGQSSSRRRSILEVQTLVETAVGISRRAFDANIHLDLVCQLQPVAISCNPGQIEQVLVNLLLNARDAVRAAHRTHGRVTVHLRRGSVPLPFHAEGSTGDVVCIDVVDNGTGMSDQTLRRMFEPFFTTKGVGKGTGLGLATSYAVVRDHHGSLTCESTPGSGSTFTVALPIAVAKLAQHGVLESHSET